MSPAQTPIREPFSVMVKPVGSACNLRCTYCYYLPTPRLGPPRMPDATLERLIAQHIAAQPGPEVSFVWHGGEPTLAGLDFYRRVVELQRRSLPAGWTCWNNLQTNGVLLDDAWCAFLAENHFDVGVSVDGTPEIHDRYRPAVGSTGSYDAAVAAVARLKAHGVRPDLLCTVTADTAADPLGVYGNLRGLGTGWLQFIPIHRRDASGKLTPDSVTGEAYGEFLCTVFDEWVRHDLGRVDVQLFAETIRTLAGGQPQVCWLAPACGRALVVEADGGVYACDHYVTPSYCLGNVLTDDLGQLANSPGQLAFGQSKAALPQTCRACPWLALCHGGCPKDRYGSWPGTTPPGPWDDPSTPGNDAPTPGLNYLCPGLTMYFAHAVPTLRYIITATRHHDTPAAIMAALAETPT